MRGFNAIAIAIALIISIINSFQGNTLNAIYFLGIAIFFEGLDIEYMLKEKE